MIHSLWTTQQNLMPSTAVYQFKIKYNILNYSQATTIENDKTDDWYYSLEVEVRERLNNLSDLPSENKWKERDRECIDQRH